MAYQPPKNIATDHSKILEEIGYKIKSLRESKPVSIKKMAEDIGISRNSLSMIERGRIYFNSSTLLLILDELDISYSDFFKDL